MTIQAFSLQAINLHDDPVLHDEGDLAKSKAAECP
jgi:hypothetical protein